MEVTLTVNGKSYIRSVILAGRSSIFCAKLAGPTRTNIGCDTSQCGVCTIHMDGAAVKACTVLAVQASGSTITTIEGLANGDQLHPMQQAFWNEHGLQCGYCTPGMIMAAVKMVEDNPNVSAEEIRHGLEGNFCRCTGYQNIVKAVQSAAAAMKA